MNNCKLYKGYIKTYGKRSAETLSGRTSWKSLEEVKHFDSYAGVLDDNTILVDVDDETLSGVLLKIIRDTKIKCKVIKTTRGRHFLFYNHRNLKCSTHSHLAVGLVADIKVGSKISYEVLKIDGNARECERDIEQGEDYDELPTWLLPVKSKVNFWEMEEGDGRNSAIFSYIRTLQRAGLKVEEIRECCRLMNKHVFKQPLSTSELETVLRDEAFNSISFYESVEGKGEVFAHDIFGDYLINKYNIVILNSHVHAYQNGAYILKNEGLDREMVNEIKNLKVSQRREVSTYIQAIAPITKPAPARYIGVANGNIDLGEDSGKGEYILLPHTPDIVVTNQIPWDYNPDAYSEDMDNALNAFACNDKQVRLLLEECVGYCFYRLNLLQKFFIFTGDKANGKSTFLRCIVELLGGSNISGVPIQGFEDKFAVANLLGKLANIGDDIGDGYLNDRISSTVRPIVSGDMVAAEFKFQNSFTFSPYAKLIYSANTIPRSKDATGALLRRMVIVPFEAKFKGKDCDKHILKKLLSRESMEYLLRLGLEGLCRALHNQDFTQSQKVDAAIEDYNRINNPILFFIEEVGKDAIVNETTRDVYQRYQLHCSENGTQALSQIGFSRQLCQEMNLDTYVRKVDGKTWRFYQRKFQ